jgi:hypothetical protein
VIRVENRDFHSLNLMDVPLNERNYNQDSRWTSPDRFISTAHNGQKRAKSQKNPTIPTKSPENNPKLN